MDTYKTIKDDVVIAEKKVAKGFKFKASPGASYTKLLLRGKSIEKVEASTGSEEKPKATNAKSK